MDTDNWRGNSDRRGATRLTREADVESVVGHEASEGTKRWFPKLFNLRTSACICSLNCFFLFIRVDLRLLHSRFSLASIRGHSWSPFAVVWPGGFRRLLE